jgi:hypothetical protein
MSNPIRRGTAGAECGFEAAVDMFNDAIGLRMESCCGDVGDIEERGKVLPGHTKNKIKKDHRSCYFFFNLFTGPQNEKNFVGGRKQIGSRGLR